MTEAGRELSPLLCWGGCEKPGPGLDPGYMICKPFQREIREELSGRFGFFFYVCLYFPRINMF